MERLHLSLALLLSLACACKESDNPVVDWGPTTDARPSRDARFCTPQSRHLSCNPVTQAGCSSGQKCAVLVGSEDPYWSRHACVPEGVALPGESCSRGPVAACAGFDDCIAGFHCIENRCARICSGSPDSCREDFEPFGTGAYCTQFESLFNDIVGVCKNACNPINDQATDAGATTNPDCDLGELCVENPSREGAVCLPPDATAL